MISDKIRSRAKIAKVCKKLKKEGKKIGFTSGSFDILHAGHALYMEKAKAKCDVLVVAINSDISVRKYKGADRPIIPEDYRMKLIAALDSVDYCYLFDERRNATNIEIIKPDYYIKAGDYTRNTLTSAEVVEKHGGEAVLIPLEEGLSTSNIVDKILSVYGEKKEDRVEKDGHVYINKTPTKTGQAVFLDRDGVINEEIEYLHEPEKFKLLPNVIEGLKEFQNMELKIIIVTHQAGIGLGYFTKEDFFKVNKEMLRQVSKEGIVIDKIYFCPHSRTEKCDCRKPKPGMLLQAQKDMNIDLSRSYMIGDMTKDIKAGKEAGVITIGVKTGHSLEDGQFDDRTDYIAKDLLDAAKFIKKQERQ